MKSERREWHCSLFFAGLILTIPALSSLLPASMPFDGGISHIHAALLGGTTALLMAALASRCGREMCSQKRFAWLAYGLLSGGMIVLALESVGAAVGPWCSIAAGFALGAGKAWAFLLWAHLFSLAFIEHARSLFRCVSFCGRFGVVGDGSARRVDYCRRRCHSLYSGDCLCI